MNHRHWQSDEWSRPNDGAFLGREIGDEIEVTEPNDGPETQESEAELEADDDSILGQFRKKIADAIAAAGSGSLTAEFREIQLAMEAYQAAIETRIALLDGLRGFCQTVQRENVNIAWPLNNGNERDLDFGLRMGVNKGAEPFDRGIRFLEEGVWSVSVYTRARGSSLTGSSECWLRLELRNSAGTMVDQFSFHQNVDTSSATIGGTVPMLIPEPGHYLTVRVWSGKWRWFDGGRSRSRMAVVKHDSRLGDLPPATAPDEEEK